MIGETDPRYDISADLGVAQTKKRAWAKIKDLFHRVLRSLRPSRMCRANWQDWHRPMCVLGLVGSMHGLLTDAFEIAFSKTPADAYSEDILG